MEKITKNTKHNHHESPNEYQFEVLFAHQSADTNICQQLTIDKTIHSEKVLDKKELRVLGHQWVDDLPMTIKVGQDQLRPVEGSVGLAYTYIDNHGNRINGRAGLPMTA